MSGNEAFELVSERGWRWGLPTMLRSGLSRWFKTRMWWTQCLIWGGLIGGILAAIAFNPQATSPTELLVLFTVFAGLFGSRGDHNHARRPGREKREGTAAWVLSKPLSRPGIRSFESHCE